MRPLSALSTGPSRPSASLMTRFVLTVAELSLVPFRAIEARRHLTTLAALNDHELADIGIGRHDLRNASSLGYGADPTAYLASVAADLARARRAEARRLAQIGRRRA